VRSEGLGKLKQIKDHIGTEKEPTCFNLRVLLSVVFHQDFTSLITFGTQIPYFVCLTFLYLFDVLWGTRQRKWLSRYAIGREAAVSSLDVIECFQFT
jgi:hypothetical protein